MRWFVTTKTYIKRVYREEDGLRLVSINPKYKDIFISYEEDPRIVGIIVGNFCADGGLAYGLLLIIPESPKVTLPLSI